ncbi:MAG: hypothetical protein E7C54_18445 [Clostridioides difficile]|nr:hypothetical protein [Clostridioides difficile]
MASILFVVICSSLVYILLSDRFNHKLIYLEKDILDLRNKNL